jgi:hypothetical protein
LSLFRVEDLGQFFLAEVVEGGPIELGHVETIAGYFGVRQDFANEGIDLSRDRRTARGGSLDGSRVHGVGDPEIALEPMVQACVF